MRLLDLSARGSDQTDPSCELLTHLRPPGALTSRSWPVNGKTWRNTAQSADEVEIITNPGLQEPLWLLLCTRAQLHMNFSSPEEKRVLRQQSKLI